MRSAHLARRSLGLGLVIGRYSRNWIIHLRYYSPSDSEDNFEGKAWCHLGSGGMGLFLCACLMTRLDTGLCWRLQQMRGNNSRLGADMANHSDTAWLE